MAEIERPVIAKKKTTRAKPPSTGKILIVRLRGEARVNRTTEDTMKMLGLAQKYTAIFLELNPSTNGMVRKIAGFVTWGEPSAETTATLGAMAAKGAIRLKPPVGGLTSIKLDWPAGDLGYRGEAINEFVKRMM